MSTTSPWIWAAFLAFVAGMMALDLGVFQRRDHRVGFREAAVWSAVWVGLAFLFAGLVLAWRGRQAGMEFLAGWLVEESLSLDNLFVFLVIFRYFALPEAQYRRVLVWGILGAVLLRGCMIGAGLALLALFTWVLEAFGVLLIWTAVRLFFDAEERVEPERNPLVRAARWVLPVEPRYRAGRFFVRRADGRWAMTPLLIVLLVVSTTDVVFATDSIPAVFAVTRDPFIVFTSNLFAVMGLRSFFFLLADVLPRFVYLRTGLAVVLGLIGLKMLGDRWVHVSTPVALGAVATVLAGSILLSLAAGRPTNRRRR